MDPEERIEARVTASSIMIKIAMDQYCFGEVAAQQQLLSLFFELLDESSTESKVHAFNLLFNIVVHANMMAEYFPKVGGEKIGGDAAPQSPQEYFAGTLCFLHHF